MQELCEANKCDTRDFESAPEMEVTLGARGQAIVGTVSSTKGTKGFDFLAKNFLNFNDKDVAEGCQEKNEKK